ncbi:MAG: hypothetical protein ACRD5B_15380, partial [Nitrososphaeraceae archaeon]
RTLIRQKFNFKDRLPCIEKWKNELNVSFSEKQLWQDLTHDRITHRQREFRFLTIHRAITTRSNLFRWKLVTDDDLCTVCHNESENILHVIAKCPSSLAAWSWLIDCFNFVTDCNLQLTPLLMVLGISTPRLSTGDYTELWNILYSIMIESIWILRFKHNKHLQLLAEQQQQQQQQQQHRQEQEQQLQQLHQILQQQLPANTDPHPPPPPLNATVTQIFTSQAIIARFRFKLKSRIQEDIYASRHSEEDRNDVTKLFLLDRLFKIIPNSSLIQLLI